MIVWAARFSFVNFAPGINAPNKIRHVAAPEIAEHSHQQPLAKQFSCLVEQDNPVAIANRFPGPRAYGWLEAIIAWAPFVMATPNID